jgi:hypothetical protein
MFIKTETPIEAKNSKGSIHDDVDISNIININGTKLVWHLMSHFQLISALYPYQ